MAGGIRLGEAACGGARKNGRSARTLPPALGAGFIQGALCTARVDAFSPSTRQLAKAAAEFRARFRQDHTLKVVHDKEAGFLVHTTVDGGAPQTTLNMIEPPVTRAMFAYVRALAAEEHAQLRGDWWLRWTKIGSAVTGAGDRAGICSTCNELLTKHLYATIIHTSCMTAHEHAADYVRLEHTKYAHLHRSRFPSVMRGVALLSRSYIGSAAKRHGVRVDIGEITAGMRLDSADRRVIRAARRVFNSVHRQRARGSLVDVIDDTRALDDAFALMGSQYGSK